MTDLFCPSDEETAPAFPTSSADPAEEGSLISALGRAAVEAERLADRLSQLDSELAALLAMGQEGATRMQRLDLLRQEAEGLALFLAMLATVTDPEGGCDPARAAEPLPLRAQAARLVGRAFLHPMPAENAQAEPDLWL